MVSIWDDVEMIREVISTSTTRFEVLQRINRSRTSAMYRRLKAFEVQHNVDISHYKPYDTHKRKRSAVNNRRLSYEEIFRLNSVVSPGVVKRRILMDQLLSYECERCKNAGTWEGSSLTLQLEHKDGNPTNNQLLNLCFLCPNCHSQTKTFAGRKNKIHQTVSRDEYLQHLECHRREQNNSLIQKVLYSGIDFSKRGWKTKVALLLNKKPQKIGNWLQRYMPEIYSKY